MIVADGVLEYLSEEEVKMLLGRLTDHFDHGQIAFDVMNSFAINSGSRKLKQKMGAVHRWAAENTEEVDELNARLKRIARRWVFRSPYLNAPFALRVIFRMMSLSPRFRNMLQILRYEF